MADNPFSYNQPHAATVFHSHGHYGSTVWDPPLSMVGKTIEVTICDDCLVANKDRVLHVVPKHQDPEYVVTPWDPELHQ